MRSASRRLAATLRGAVVVLVALSLATPAAAQFGGLKKRIKSAAGSEAAAEAEKKAGVAAAPGAPADAAGPAGGTVVLTPDVVERLVAASRRGRPIGRRPSMKTRRTAATSRARPPSRSRSPSASRAGRPSPTAWPPTRS